MTIRRCALLGLLGASASFAGTEWNFGWEGNDQGVWSGSDPQEFTVGVKPCDYKVRGRSGVWSDFSGKIDSGKIVIGVVNPREPDIIFFQLKKQSPFLFVAKRTCFHGETPYVEDPVEAARNKKLDYPLAWVSYLYIRRTDRISSSVKQTTATNLIYLAGGKEWVDGLYRLYLGAGLGFGAYGWSLSDSGVDTTTEGKRIYALPIYLGGYYDLPDTPYSAGLEMTLGYSLSRQTLVSDGTTTSATNFFWSLGMAWRVYYNNWIFVPKVGVYDGLSPKFFEFQIGYLFQ